MRVLILLVLSVFIVTACSSPSDKVFVEVNGKKITQSELDFLSELNPRLKGQLINPFHRKRVLENLVQQELLYQSATKEGIQREDHVKAKIDLYRRVIISEAFVTSEVENAAKKYYDENPDEFKKLELAHIMIGYADAATLKKNKGKKGVRSEEAALELAKKTKTRLDAGEEFAKVAAEASEDNASARRGGTLGRVAKNERSLESRGWTELLTKAFEMNVGEVSGPIKTPKGYHLITITGGIELEPFEGAKDRLVQQLRTKVRDDLLAELQKNAKVIYPEEKKEDAAPETEGATPAPEQTEPQHDDHEHDHEHGQEGGENK